MTDVPPSSEGDVNSSVAIVAPATSSGLEESELKTALADSVSDLLDSVVRSLCSNTPWVAEAGPRVPEPFGNLSGMGFTVVTKAAWALELVGRSPRAHSLWPER